MFVHRISLGFMLVHVVYLSAIPVLPVDDKKRTPVLAANLEPLEPWEVNQELIDHKGVHSFCRPLNHCVYISVLAENPLICRSSSCILTAKVNRSQTVSSVAKYVLAKLTAFEKERDVSLIARFSPWA